MNPVVHKTHVYLESGSLILAVFHVIPPSVLTSTFEIPLSPPNAIPAIGTLLLDKLDLVVKFSSKFLNLFIIGACPGITMEDPVLYSAIFDQPFLCQYPSYTLSTSSISVSYTHL